MDGNPAPDGRLQAVEERSLKRRYGLGSAELRFSIEHEEWDTIDALPAVPGRLGCDSLICVLRSHVRHGFVQVLSPGLLGGRPQVVGVRVHAIRKIFAKEDLLKMVLRGLALEIFQKGMGAYRIRRAVALSSEIDPDRFSGGFHPRSDPRVVRCVGRLRRAFERDVRAEEKRAPCDGHRDVRPLRQDRGQRSLEIALSDPTPRSHKIRDDVNSKLRFVARRLSALQSCGEWVSDKCGGGHGSLLVVDEIGRAHV